MSNFKSLFRKKGETASQVESVEADNPRFASMFRKVGSATSPTVKPKHNTGMAKLFRPVGTDAKLGNSNPSKCSKGRYPLLDKLVAQFGQEQGWAYFREGLSYEEALDAKCTQLQAEIDAMVARTERANAKHEELKQRQAFVEAGKVFFEK